MASTENGMEHAVADPGLTKNQVEVFSYMSPPYNNYADAKFYVIIY